MTDVAVIGGGPAGAAAAITLARLGLGVVIFESSRYEAPRVGETLPPAARPILGRLGLADAVAALGSTPSYGNRSAWGGEDVLSNPFVFGPHGNGWHVDRTRFDRCLADAAVAVGAERRSGAHATVAFDDVWSVTADGVTIAASGLIDASGRRAAVARRLGARRLLLDHLVGVALRFAGPAHDAGSTLIEATPDGWWYSAPLPSGQTMVMFMTDADVCRRSRLRDRAVWHGRLLEAPATVARVTGYDSVGTPEVVSAVSHRLERDDVGEPWVAAGDAALGVDPLSSSGVLRALLTGEAAAYAIAHRLLGRVEAVVDYERWLDAQFAEYVRERRAYYELEDRWPEAPFWERRRGTERVQAERRIEWSQ